MPSAENPRWRPSTSGCSPLPPLSWPGRERDRLPARSTLSRFLADLTKAPVEALRTLFLDDLLSRPLTNERQTGNLVDRTGGEWIVFDLDGTREAARQRALPQAEDLPPPFRRLDDVCAAFLHRAQAGAGGAYPHDHQPGPQFPLARLVWQSRQRSLPRGTASGPVGHWSLSHRAPVSTSTRAAPARWSIWHGGRSLRSRWLRFRDPRQRLHRPGSSARAGAAGTCLPISPNSARKARSCAASTTVQKCRL